MKSNIKKNFLLTSLYQLIYVLTPLLTTPYISRVLGADGIGDYSFAFSVATYFTLFIRLGLNTYGNRTIATVRDDKVKLSKTFCEIYAMQLGCGATFTSLYVLWILLFAPRVILSFILLLLVLSAIVDITWLLYGVEDFVVTTIRDICVRLSTVALIFFFVKSPEDLWKYTLIQGTGYMAGQILAWLRIKRHIVFVLPRATAVLAHLKPNLVLFIPSIAVSLYKTMDKIMLGVMAASSELGFYESSERVINVPMALITALGTVMLPRMSNLFATGEDETLIKNMISRSLCFSTFVSSLVSFGILSVASQFVPLFYGKGYEKCISLYKWLLPSCVFLSFAQCIKNQYLIPRKKDWFFIASVFGGAISNLILNFFLIPKYQSEGAAISTLVAEATVCIIQIIYVWTDLSILKPLLISLFFAFTGIVMCFLSPQVHIDSIGRITNLLLQISVNAVMFFTIVGVYFVIANIVKKAFAVIRNE